MKFKKLLLVSVFLLAILTIGAVSASENLTDNDALDTAGEVTLESTDSSELLGDGSYFDGDLYIYVEENFNCGKRDWNSHEVLFINSYSEKNTTIDILVDDVEKQCIKAPEGYFAIEIDENGTEHKIFSTYLYPNDLGITPGSHSVKVNVNGNACIDTSVSAIEKEDFTIWLQNPYYCEEEYWKSPSFIIIDSNGLNNGTLEIYVNGTRKLSYSVTKGLFEEIEDCSSKSRYVAASDLIEGYGTYNIQIRFTENGTVKTLRNETVAVAEFAPTTNPRLEVYFDLYTVNLPADDIAHIYLPREATGTLTISYNNVKDKVIEYSKGYATEYIHAWDLNHLGENKITVTYNGDDFGTLTTTETVIVVPTITAPSYVSLGEEFTISMMTHEWVNGKFNVYDYTGDVKGKLLASSTISNRYSSVKLSSDNPGLNKYYLEFAYPGGYYPVIQEVIVVKNSERITVDVPEEVEKGNFSVVLTAPAADFTFAQITVDDGDTDFVMLKDGVAIKNISNLSTGYHSIRVFYENEYYIDGKIVSEIYLKTFTVAVGIKTQLSAPQISTVYNVGKNMVITLKDANGKPIVGKTVVVTLNGKNYTPTTGPNGQVKVSSYNLAPKSYPVKVKFAGDDKYLESNDDSKVIVNKASPKITASNKAFKLKTKTKQFTITLKNNKNAVMKNKKVTLTVGNKKYTAKTNSKGKATFKITKLNKKGTYKAVIKYAGDSYYKSVSKNTKITVKK